MNVKCKVLSGFKVLSVVNKLQARLKQLGLTIADESYNLKMYHEDNSFTVTFDLQGKKSNTIEAEIRNCIGNECEFLDLSPR